MRGALVALIGQDDQAGGLQLGQDASDPLGLLVVHRSGWPGHPQDVPVGAGDDLLVHAVLFVLAGVERPVRAKPLPWIAERLDPLSFRKIPSRLDEAHRIGKPLPDHRARALAVVP